MSVFQVVQCFSVSAHHFCPMCEWSCTKLGAAAHGGLIGSISILSFCFSISVFLYFCACLIRERGGWGRSTTLGFVFVFMFVLYKCYIRGGVYVCSGVYDMMMYAYNVLLSSHFSSILVFIHVVVYRARRTRGE